MSVRFQVLAVAALALPLISGCVTAPSPSAYRSPAPARPVEASRLYTGTWLEIARLPMNMTDGCVAGTTTYVLTGPEAVTVRDTCRAGSPEGREKAIGARADILDPGTNARLRVRYFGGFVTWDFWILDHADDYSWFISADPTFDRLWIYTREVPSPAQRDRLVARASALGYDTRRLEFPAF